MTSFLRGAPPPKKNPGSIPARLFSVACLKMFPLCFCFCFNCFFSEFDISLCITCCEKDWDITVGAVYVDSNLAAWFHWLEVLWLWSHYPFWKYLLVDFWQCRLTLNDLTKRNIRQKWYWGLNWHSCISLINVEDFTIHMWTQFKGCFCRYRSTVYVIKLRLN